MSNLAQHTKTFIHCGASQGTRFGLHLRHPSHPIYTTLVPQTTSSLAPIEPHPGHIQKSALGQFNPGTRTLITKTSRYIPLGSSNTPTPFQFFFPCPTASHQEQAAAAAAAQQPLLRTTGLNSGQFQSLDWLPLHVLLRQMQLFQRGKP